VLRRSVFRLGARGAKAVKEVLAGFAAVGNLKHGMAKRHRFGAPSVGAHDVVAAATRAIGKLFLRLRTVHNVLTSERLNVFGERTERQRPTPLPLFFVSVASKGFRFFVSPLDATYTGGS